MGSILDVKSLSKELLLDMYYKMVLIRRFEEKLVELYRIGKIPGIAHGYIGEEAVAVGVCSALRRDDYILSTHRGHGHSLAKGVDPKYLMAELMARKTGVCKGIGGSMHSTEPEVGVIFSSAIVAGSIPIAVGVALAFKMRREDRVVVSFFGDGATNRGTFHEALNLASIWKLPVIFVCENNYYALSTPFYKACAGESIAARAASYDVRSYLIPDANDVLAVYSTAKEAVEYIREGNGPAFIECRTYRKKGHGVYDTGFYRPKEEVEFWMKKDPIERFSSKLKNLGLVTDDEIKNIDALPPKSKKRLLGVI